MATVSLSGLPSHCKLPKLVMIMKSLLKRQDILKFWIKEMADIRGTDLKSASVEFYSADEAYRAVKVMDGFDYNNGQYSYRLSARLEDEERRPRRKSPSPYYRRDREYRDRYEESRYSGYNDYSRDRSRSPVSREASKLDLEIELLRKQRMIIEEERRLLLERKKLELVKEFGPSALKEFKSLEDDRDRDRDRRYRPERERAAGFRPRRRTPPPPRARPAPRQRPPLDRVQLPQFVLPCKLLLGEFKEIMERLGNPKESFLLTKLIKTTLRKRLAVALEGKPIMSGAKIAALYREKYPAHQDEDFVKRHLRDIRACHMPSKGDDTTKSTEKNVDEGNEEENNEVEKPDADVEGSHHTGSVKSETEEIGTCDLKINVKEEPNTSTEIQVSGSLEIAEQAERIECNRSVGSSEALTLHDKNDEDWAEGENDWDDTNKETQV